MRFVLVVLAVVFHVMGCQSVTPDRERAPAIDAAAAGSADPNVSTFLMFQEGNAQEAVTLYQSVFPDVRVERMERYGAGGPGPEGTVKVARVDLCGHRLMFSDNYVKHKFTFTPSISLFVDFASAQELDRAFAKLSKRGKVLMPLDKYDFSRRFAWCVDRFGVSWQLNLQEPTSPTTQPAS